MKVRKLLCTLLALMTAASLAACGSGSGTTSTSTSGSTDSGKTTSTADKGNADKGNSDTSSDAGQTTFRVAICRWAESWGLDFTQTALLNEISESTGATIEWDTYYYADWAEQKSLLLAGGDLPDAFFGSIALTDTDIAQNKLNLYELTDLIAENMPNLSKILAE